MTPDSRSAPVVHMSAPRMRGSHDALRPAKGAICRCAHPVTSHYGPTHRGPCSVRNCGCYGS